jgi:hypothetical protein
MLPNGGPRKYWRGLRFNIRPLNVLLPAGGAVMFQPSAPARAVINWGIVAGFRQFVETIGGLVHPAALAAGLRAFPRQVKEQLPPGATAKHLGQRISKSSWLGEVGKR